MATVDTESFGFLVTDIARLFRAEVDKRISSAGIGVTPGEGRTLAHVARAGAVRQTVLADRMGVEAMTLSGYIDRLEARGLVERRPDPTDRRAKLLFLTDAAGEVLAEIRRIAMAVHAEASRSIAPEDWQKLRSLLKAVRDDLAALKCEAARQPEGEAA